MNFLFILEIIGTAAFALSGALIAVEKKLDYLGVVVLAVSAAVGGGLIRDMILGNTPPVMFTDPTYSIVAAITAFIVIVLARIAGVRKVLNHKVILSVIMVTDAIGLGVFTVVGINVAMALTFGGNAFLCIFVGVITGVGGGILRDIFANRIPNVLKKDIYVLASAIGGAAYYWLSGRITDDVALYASAGLVILIRVLAVRFDIHLPIAYISKEKSNEDL